jgi:hypothetical protein
MGRKKSEFGKALGAGVAGGVALAAVIGSVVILHKSGAVTHVGTLVKQGGGYVVEHPAVKSAKGAMKTGAENVAAKAQSARASASKAVKDVTEKRRRAKMRDAPPSAPVISSHFGYPHVD